MLSILYKSLVQLVLEYGNLLLGPFHIHDQIQVEKVKKKAICSVIVVSHLPYMEHLSTLNLLSLSYTLYLPT